MSGGLGSVLVLSLTSWANYCTSLNLGNHICQMIEIWICKLLFCCDTWWLCYWKLGSQLEAKNTCTRLCMFSWWSWQPARWPWQEDPDASWKNSLRRKTKLGSRSLTDGKASVDRTVVILNVWQCLSFLSMTKFSEGLTHCLIIN